MRHHVVVVRFLAAVSLLVGIVGVSSACLNDRDTDAVSLEARGLPGTAEVITGRFERNPPLYYQMRIDRISGELQRKPNQPDLYDDISVAFDRIGRDDDALHWIEHKRKYLPVESPTNSPTDREEWYRYYANSGTFLVHQWFRAGATAEKIAALTDARNRIARAIAIKPNAHFGREKYQLMVIDWLAATAADEGTDSRNALGRFIVATVRGNLPKNLEGPKLDAAYRAAYDEASTGLSGLVVLGNAWESPDIFGALADTLNESKKSRLGYLAGLRCRELLQAGKHSFAIKDERPGETWEQLTARLSHSVANKSNLEDRFKILRDEADRWQSERDTYMLTRLRTGRHPDTDPTFWNDYHSSPPPSLDGPWIYDVAGNVAAYMIVKGGNIIPGLGIACAILAWGISYARRLRASRSL